MGAFMKDKLDGSRPQTEFIAVEPASCPSLTRGRYAYDFSDTGHVTPLARMYTLGSEFIPSANHAGGLRYHGMSPILSKLYHDGYMRAVAVEQTKVFEAAVLFAKHETILPAPESSHAIRAAIDEAIKSPTNVRTRTENLFRWFRARYPVTVISIVLYSERIPGGTDRNRTILRAIERPDEVRVL